jgi:hypothetical protein
MDFIALRDYARNLVGRIATSGWRPLFGWGGGFMLLCALKFAYMDAPLQGIGLPDGYYMGLNTCLGLFLGAFVARGVEKHMERANRPGAAPPYTAPSGGLTNNEAIS